jgi:hypothetical protein
MVEDELSPERSGEVKRHGNVAVAPIVHRMVEDIERHGEVHATFEHVDGEVECRLGTTKINAQHETIEVFDGDQWHAFAADKLVTWEVPMDLYH